MLYDGRVTIGKLKMDSKEKNNNFIYALKAIAIFSVVCAHSTPLPDGSGRWNVLCSQILDYLGTFGVPVFFCISGYLFAGNTRTLREFWQRKVTTLFLPWIFCETVLWFYVVLRKGGISITAWLLFLLGYHHTTYYLTILVIFYVIYWKIRSNKVVWALNLISILSIVETGWNVGIFHRLNGMLNSYYLNPFNWMIFFGIGILVRRQSQKIVEMFFDWKGLLCLFGSVIYFSINNFLGQEMYYFSRFALLGNLLNIGTVIYLGHKLMNVKGKKAIWKIGETSFSIYLLHQFFAGIVVAVTNYWDCFILTLCRPWIILGITVGAVMAIEWCFRGKMQWVRRLVGER